MGNYTSQCLFYALRKWYEEGGYLMLGRSVHWCIPHVLHMSNDGIITHFAPDNNLKTPWHSLIGFQGHVFIKDTAERKPMNIFCMLLGTVALFVFGGVWAIKTYFMELKSFFKLKMFSKH